MDFDIANSGGLRIGQSVIYVGDGKSGKVVGYGVRYDPSAIRRGTPSNGEITVIANMLTRKPEAVRNQGR